MGMVACLENLAVSSLCVDIITVHVVSCRWMMGLEYTSLFCSAAWAPRGLWGAIGWLRSDIRRAMSRLLMALAMDNGWIM